MAALLAAWGLRLCAYLTLRNWGHGEDRRYREIRARNQPGFGFKSLYLVFGLQALLAWIVSLPALVVALGAGRAPRWLDVAGGLLMAFGIAFEAVADAQMRRFRADPRHAAQVMDRGLWRLTRHPNYFGECCVWWGLWLLALAAAGPRGAWSVVSPLLMTFLLLRISGVQLLEKDIALRRPAYRDYIARTNAFWPGRPKPSRSPRNAP
jgi:steroid 5-alpha reductase family enzyme